MKANELMIGDWVRPLKKKFGGIPGRIITIDGGTNTCWIDSDEYSCLVSCSDVERIPLTPEILEKNGFVQNPRSKSRRSHQICTDSVYISWWRGRLNILFKPFIGHSTNHVNVDGKYVHELQHALRLCGIEKEIVL